MTMDLVSVQDVRKALERISPYTHRTPLLTSQSIDEIATSSIFPDDSDDHDPSSASSSSSPSKVKLRIAFKAEHLQRVGAFKYRGATNAVLVHLRQAETEFLEKGGKKEDWDPSRLWVVTHSSGNHAAALACAARTVGARAAVVMPENAPLTKQRAVAGYGAEITFCKPIQKERESTAERVMAELRSKGFLVKFVHPYDEPLVIAGQGTMALEMLEQVGSLQSKGFCSESVRSVEPSSAGSTRGTKRAVPLGPKAQGIWQERGEDEPALDILIAPVGGGGMLSGVSTAIKGTDERIVVIGAEPEAVDDAARSFTTNLLQPSVLPALTVCDGLLTSLSARTLSHIQERVDTISTVSEVNILRALRLHWERQKQLVEPSAAVGLATLLQAENGLSRGRGGDSGGTVGTEEGKRFWGLRRWIEEIVRRKLDHRQLSHGSEGDVEIRIGIIWSGGNLEVEKIVPKLEALGV